MKKVILIAGILTAGIMSANTISSNNEKSTISKSEKEIVVKDSKSEKAQAKFYPIYYTTSCGLAASTNQTDWTVGQMMAWAEALEANYCN